MAWFGSVRSFHSSALNSFARELAKLPNAPPDKVEPYPQENLYKLWPTHVSMVLGWETVWLLSSCACWWRAVYTARQRSLSYCGTGSLCCRLTTQGSLKIALLFCDSCLHSVQIQCDRIVDYFVKLVQSFPRAVWVQNTQIAAKKGRYFPHLWCQYMPTYHANWVLNFSASQMDW